MQIGPEDFPITDFPEIEPGESTTAYQGRVAIAQFVTRHNHWKGKETHNEEKHAGHPMVYHCEHCGMVSDILPEDFFCRPRTVCSMCDGLVKLNLIEKAKAALQQEKLP